MTALRVGGSDGGREQRLLAEGTSVCERSHPRPALSPRDAVPRPPDPRIGLREGWGRFQMIPLTPTLVIC